MSNAVLAEQRTDNAIFRFNIAEFNQAGQQLLLVCPAGYELYKKRCGEFFGGVVQLAERETKIVGKRPYDNILSEVDRKNFRLKYVAYGSHDCQKAKEMSTAGYNITCIIF